MPGCRDAGDIGVGISMPLSYDDDVPVRTVLDEKLFAGPREVVDRFLPEFETCCPPCCWLLGRRGETEDLGAIARLHRVAGRTPPVRLAGEQEQAAAAPGGDGDARRDDEAASGGCAEAGPPRRKRSAFAGRPRGRAPNSAVAAIAIHRDDAYARQCEAVVARIADEGVELDRAIFSPLGGGHHGDVGTLHLAQAARCCAVVRS